MKQSKKDILIALMFILFIFSHYFGTSFIKMNYSSGQSSLLPYIWVIIWTLILIILFSIDHIKVLLSPGNIKINLAYLILSLLILTMYIPGTPLFLFFFINQTEVLLLIFWYSLIHVFYKE